MPLQRVKSYAGEQQERTSYADFGLSGFGERAGVITSITVEIKLGSGIQYWDRIHDVLELEPGEMILPEGTVMWGMFLGLEPSYSIGQRAVSLIDVRPRAVVVTGGSLISEKLDVFTSSAGTSTSWLSSLEAEFLYDLLVREKPSSITDFAEFFASLVSQIPEVTQVLADIHEDTVDIFTIFDSEDEKTYDSVYDAQKTTFTRFANIYADFHTINLRDFGKDTLRNLISSTSRTLFSRS
ncbi:hypothetical protein E3J95_00915 [Candidatus Aerophobetes bacterium]|uniref:Uncharacterized protein n=1 Tax=Aerophobetes bacterium TaxID=2030807 RepID=A0A523QM62_UNCAE|nr:MAG: hypothetical protein E3J95_00915 [Candidatus Aerophobetes bacterium]